MGLNCSHGAWDGGYSSFGTWRRIIAVAAELPPLKLMEGFYWTQNEPTPGLPIKWECLKPSPLHILLSHSDCDGYIAPDDCGAIAIELEKLIPKIPDEWGKEKTVQFIKGLRLASECNEPLLFR